jgi:ATP-dependent Clp protease adaptor protein ClpS
MMSSPIDVIIRMPPARLADGDRKRGNGAAETAVVTKTRPQTKRPNLYRVLLLECGIYTYEVAETKVTQVVDFARKHQHPLQCIMEKN